MSYLHESWFSPSQLKKMILYKMCQFCGNENPKVMNCQNCDIGFEFYVYVEYT